MELIKSIGKVNEVMTRTEADAVKKKLQAVQDAYNKLTADQKQMVTNYADLQAAAAAYQTYETNYAAAKATEDLIKAIGTVTKDSYDAIQKATEAYNKLTATQKKLVEAKLVQQLQDASARYKELLEQTTDATARRYRPTSCWYRMRYRRRTRPSIGASSGSAWVFWRRQALLPL